MATEPSVRIDLQALRHNLSVARRAAPASRVMAVIKANGYGHGLLPVAAALEEADSLAVARVSEGLALREAGIRTPVVILEGFLDKDELLAAVRAELALVIHQAEQLRLLQGNKLSAPVSCWLKVDTGMNRLGFPVPEAPAVFHQLKDCDGVRGAPGLMTHLASADEREDQYSSLQLQRLRPLLSEFGVESSIANSAAILGWPESHADWNRPGLMLYGASPFAGVNGSALDLRPVMSFTAGLIALKTLKKGDPVGYGGTWQAPQDMQLGVVGAGYGDGFPREIANGTKLLLNGKKVPLVGRVSMDMMTLDLRTAPETKLGDEVTLWGEGLPVEEIALAAGTIPYTLLCGITSRVQCSTS